MSDPESNQDGLVHISALSNSFVKGPHSVVKAGQIVKVKVLEVDEKRKRIALTMRAERCRGTGRREAITGPAAAARRSRSGQTGWRPYLTPAPAPMGAMAAAFSKLKG